MHRNLRPSVDIVYKSKQDNNFFQNRKFLFDELNISGINTVQSLPHRTI